MATEKKASAGATNDAIEQLVAIDDGHSEIKVAYFTEGTSGEIKTFSFPSRTIRGWEDMDPTGAAAPNAYLAFDTPNHDFAGSSKGTEMLVVGRGRSGGENENRTQDYPVSDRNRTLVHHALHLIAAGRNMRFSLATALPYAEFHLPSTGQHNAELIEKKKASLLRSVASIDPKTHKPVPPSYTIENQIVFSEGVATFFDCMIDYAGNEVALNASFAAPFQHSSSFAVIDIGGKTTDIVFGSWTGSGADRPLVRVKQSTSLKEGTLDAADQLGALIKNKYNLRKVNDPEKALFDRSMGMFGQLQDVGAECDDVLGTLFQKVREPVLRHLEDASDFARVIFVGGGSMLMKEQLASLFNESVVLIPEEPQFANAKGMLKMLKAFHA